jgi:hypothetical protein
MLDDFVGRCHQMQGLAPVAHLPTHRLTAAPSLAAGTLARQRVARWRFAAIVAIFGQPAFQLLHPSVEMRHQFVVRTDLLLLRCREHFEVGHTSGWCHASMLHLLRKCACTVPIHHIPPTKD